MRPSKKELIDYWKKTKMVTDRRVLKAFEDVKREDFVPDGELDYAYGDYPLPIGYNQTISQPSTVMIMTQDLKVKEGNKVLEVGAGSGYQAALLGKLVGSKGLVITAEIIPELAEFAKKNLKKAGIKNVKVVCCDGSMGYKKEAPYDRIIVTASCPAVPLPLIEQLKENGIILAPVGSSFFGQKMIKGVKKKGKLKTEFLGYYAFVPLKGKYGF